MALTAFTCEETISLGGGDDRQLVFDSTLCKGLDFGSLNVVWEGKVVPNSDLGLVVRVYGNCRPCTLRTVLRLGGTCSRCICV